MYRIDLLSIPFGKDMDGEQMNLHLNLRSCTNCYIYGRVGSGKTNLLRTIAFNAIDKYGENNINVWCVNLKCDEFSDLQKFFPTALRNFSAFSKDEIKKVLDIIYNEMNNRRILYKEKIISSYSDLNGKCIIPRLLILIDDYYPLGLFLQSHTDLMCMFEVILTESRAFGISVVIADQVSLEHQIGMTFRAKGNIPSLISLTSNDTIVNCYLDDTEGFKIEDVSQHNLSVPGSLVYKDKQAGEDIYKCGMAFYCQKIN